MDELVDQLAVDEVQDGGPGLDQGHRDVQGAEDGGVFDPDDPRADHGQAARQAGEVEDLVAVENALAVEGDVGRPIGPRADRDHHLVGGVEGDLAGRAGDLDRMGVLEPRRPVHDLHAVAGELVLQDVDFVVQGLVQAGQQVLGAQVLLHPIGAAIEAALAPAGQVQHGLAQGLGGDGAGVHRDAAHAAALVDHQHGPAELGRLHGRAPTRRPAADDDHVVVVHSAPTAPGSGLFDSSSVPSPKNR